LDSERFAIRYSDSKFLKMTEIVSADLEGCS